MALDKITIGTRESCSRHFWQCWEFIWRHIGCSFCIILKEIKESKCKRSSNNVCDSRSKALTIFIQQEFSQKGLRKILQKSHKYWIWMLKEKTKDCWKYFTELLIFKQMHTNPDHYDIQLIPKAINKSTKPTCIRNRRGREGRREIILSNSWTTIVALAMKSNPVH